MANRSFCVGRRCGAEGGNHRYCHRTYGALPTLLGQIVQDLFQRNQSATCQRAFRSARRCQAVAWLPASVWPSHADELLWNGRSHRLSPNGLTRKKTTVPTG